MKKNFKLIGIISLLIIAAVFLLYSYMSSGNDELIKNDDEDVYEETAQGETDVQDTKQIVVEIKGAIKNPNVYWLSEESIVEDLIEKAGGLEESADTCSVNRAEKLKNHELVVIPDKNKQDINENSNENLNNLRSKKDNSSSQLVNINTADAKELDTLPGIGPSKAEDIISYREENGEFKSIEDIKNVKGIGDSSFEKLKDKITV